MRITQKIVVTSEKRILVQRPLLWIVWRRCSKWPVRWWQTWHQVVWCPKKRFLSRPSGASACSWSPWKISSLPTFALRWYLQLQTVGSDPCLETIKLDTQQFGISLMEQTYLYRVQRFITNFTLLLLLIRIARKYILVLITF